MVLNLDSAPARTGMMVSQNQIVTLNFLSSNPNASDSPVVEDSPLMGLCSDSTALVVLVFDCVSHHEIQWDSDISMKLPDPCLA